ncbi:CSC1/OSCA1-like, cytosolic domain, partial [Dillenia turbinata]
MNAQSLFASAAINIGLAFVVLSLFSILKKQPSNASVYYARRLSQRQSIHFDRFFSLSRFLPSFSWIFRAFRVSEDEIVQTSGLDALVLIRLFKFGVNFFLASSAVGLLVLLPVNYTSQGGPSRRYLSYSLDSFSISNISGGSDRLWVHYMCLWIITSIGLYMLYKEYNVILVKRIQRLRDIRHSHDQFTVLVRQIPLCIEHESYGCSVDHFFSKHHPHSYQCYQMLFDGKEFQVLLAASIATKIEEMRQKPTTKKCKGETTLLDVFYKEDAKITLQEECLQEIYHKIHILQSESTLKEKEMPVAFVTFKSRWGAAIAAQTQQHSSPLMWITEWAPEPRDVLWKNLEISYSRLPLQRIGVFLASSLLTIFFTLPVTAVQGIAKFEKLKKWFPPAKAIELIPGLRSIVTGYIPSVVLSGFIYVVPFAMLALAELAGFISKSKTEIKACNMIYYFLMGNVFFLSVLSGSLLDQIGESVTHPKDFPSRLASAVAAQADFFMTYILTNGIAGFSLEILQAGLLSWNFIRLHTYGRGKKSDPFLYSLPYFRIIPFVSLSILIGLVYAIIAPLLLPFLVGYFLFGLTVYINQIQDVYEIVYETCGQYWPYIHHYIFIAIILMQVTMIGLFGLKLKPAAAIATIPLLLLTLMFNEYCKSRFLPSFCQYPIQNAMENDDLDQEDHMLEENYESAEGAYCPPCLHKIKFLSPGSSSRDPL